MLIEMTIHYGCFTIGMFGKKLNLKSLKSSEKLVRSGKYLDEKLKAWKEEITTNCSCSKLSSQ